MPSVASAPGIDESGFLMVARQWHAGTSLYGNYWVDRPPLLITLYALSDALGGLVPLRVVGALAGAMVVLGAGRAARAWGVTSGLRSRRSEVWAATAAAALCLTPVLGATEVNGELLAAPFVAWGLAVTVHAMNLSEGWRQSYSMAGAGALAAAAVLIKQNFVDVFLFIVVLVAAAVASRHLAIREGLRLLAGTATGASVAAVGASVWTVAHGTSLIELYRALYPFRVAAAQVVAAGDNPAVDARGWALLGRVMLSGVPIVVLLASCALVRRRRPEPVTSALLAVIAYDSMSIFAGGSYWGHYLVQLIVPVSLLIGGLVGRRVWGMRVVAAWLVTVSLVGWAGAVPAAGAQSSEATTLGAAVGRVAAPNDTVVTLYGHSDVTAATGLSSPYRHLWSLPVKTLDSHLEELNRLLTGRGRPTWLITWGSLHTWGDDSARTEALVARHYRRVAELDGHSLFLADGVFRRTPSLTPSPALER